MLRGKTTDIFRIEKPLFLQYTYRSPSSAAYLLDVCVEGDRHVQQDLSLLHAANKVLDPVLQLVGGLVDLLGVALARLGKLLGRLQQLVRIGVRVLRESGGARGVNSGWRSEEVC